MNPVVSSLKKAQTLDDIPISRELVQWLEKTLPERCPDPMDTERQIWMYAGKRALVRSLSAAYERQQNKGGVVQ